MKATISHKLSVIVAYLGKNERCVIIRSNLFKAGIGVQSSVTNKDFFFLKIQF